MRSGNKIDRQTSPHRAPGFQSRRRLRGDYGFSFFQTTAITRLANKTRRNPQLRRDELCSNEYFAALPGRASPAIHANSFAPMVFPINRWSGRRCELSNFMVIFQNWQRQLPSLAR
jgi:hypothetical protein